MTHLVFLTRSPRGGNRSLRAAVRDLIGRRVVVRGPVLEGDRRGRELGFPTANVALRPDSASPTDGVYAGWLTRRDTGERWPAAISVGTNPTFGGERERRVEAHVLDRDDLALYGVQVEVEFHDKLRDMVEFDSVGALINQMNADVERTRQLTADASVAVRPGRRAERLIAAGSR